MKCCLWAWKAVLRNISEIKCQAFEAKGLIVLAHTDAILITNSCIRKRRWQCNPKFV